MSSQCPKCGIWGGMTAAHDCLPSNYQELERVTDEDIAIEREARRLGIHPYQLVQQRRKEAEERQRDAELSKFNAKYGFDS